MGFLRRRRIAASMENEIAVRSVGEDEVWSGSKRRGDGGPAGDRFDRSRDTRQSDEPEVVVQANPEPESQPFLLQLVDGIVELLASLWDRLRSV